MKQRGKMNNFLLKESGFTLVELVVVMVLLGILAAVALPKFFNVSDYQERADYDEVAGAVRYAQKLAVASGCEVRVVIGGGNYALQQCSPAVGCTDGIGTFCAAANFNTLANHPITNNPSVATNLSPQTFIFNAMGRSSNAVTVTVGTKAFNVTAETGYVNAP